MEYINSIGMKFRLIPPGEFLMGSTDEEIAAAIAFYERQLPMDQQWPVFVRSEGPRHRVILQHPIFMSVCETTQDQFQRVMDRNPSAFSANGAESNLVANLVTVNFPVEIVAWNDVAEFCIRLSELESISPGYRRIGEQFDLNGTGYRLPSEAEWEFACRAGTQAAYWHGDNPDALPGVTWLEQSSDGRPHEVGELSANPFGLFDLLGNVEEFCYDNWDASDYGRYQASPAVNPLLGDPSIPECVVRGGHWLERMSASARCASRSPYGRTVPSRLHGFRPILMVDAVRQLNRP